ncbi:hypothetical protein DFJ58DRAFT_671494, partial [Suillus subalutaceus]|uniref:uncharacterized protein n=1 Tax=Suillus subalutaceus TaxID=48586 RepID=UPI001B86C9B3
KCQGINSSPYYWFTDQCKYGIFQHGGYGFGIRIIEIGNVQPVRRIPCAFDCNCIYNPGSCHA